MKHDGLKSRAIPVTIFSFLLALTLAPLSPAMAQAPHRTSSPGTVDRIRDSVANPDRPESHRARDKYRHPLETLTFFGVEPSLTLVEIWPGGQGGWYRRILSPLFEGRGNYIPVTGGSGFPGPVTGVPYGQVDMVFVFRAHGFMIYSHPAQDYVDAVYAMLRPGGIFGIVDHAGDESIPQDPSGENGYVNESHFRMMAEKAGFKLLADSGINRNPKDTKAHPNGVYSLPPALRGSRYDDAKRAQYMAIGESDRFTLKYYKPLK